MNTNQKVRRLAEKGFSLVELLIALTVLVIGMGGIMIMIATAVAQNNGSKHDSSATMLAQMVTEQILSMPANLNPPAAGPGNPAETDCAGTVWQIAIAGAAAPGAGAQLSANGNINFGQAIGAVPPNYGMQFVACGTNLRQATYDVRWNVQTLTANTKLVTVAARRRDQGRNGVGFNVPVTIRTVAGP